MAKKPRNKKYNHRKLDQWMERVATKGTVLIQAQGLGKDGKIWIFHDKPVPKGEWLIGGRMTDYRLTFLTPHKWTILAGVACRDQLGRNFYRYAQQSANNELIYHDPQIQQWIMEFLAEQIQEVNKEHILSSFFFAFPAQTEMCDSDVEKLLHWLNIFDPDNLKTHYEMQQIKAKAESEISELDLEDYLPKQTACTLRKHGIADLMQMFWLDEDRLRNMKGMGEKRCNHVYDALKRLAKENRNFYDLAWDNHRGDECKKFIIEDQKNSQEFYQLYLESRRNK